MMETEISLAINAEERESALLALMLAVSLRVTLARIRA